MKSLSALDIDMCNVHAAGTIDMMKAGLRGLTKGDGERPLLIAVTQLTSTSEERMRDDLLINEPMDKVVMHYAKNAADAGLLIGIYFFSQAVNELEAVAEADAEIEAAKTALINAPSTTTFTQEEKSAFRAKISAEVDDMPF